MNQYRHRHYFPSSRVKVEKLYEVQCEECGNPNADFYKTRTEADEARQVHIEYHRREGS